MPTSVSPCRAAGMPNASSSAASTRRSFSRMVKLSKPEPAQHVADRRQQLDLHDERGRPDGVDVALVELAEPSARGSIRAPHGLNLVALEESRQLVLILRHHPRQRHRQIVSQRQVGLAGPFVLASLEDLENQLVAFVAVLPEQRLDVLERRRLERLEAVPLVHLPDNPDDVLTSSDVVGQEIARPARWLCTAHPLLSHVVEPVRRRSGRRTSESQPSPRRRVTASPWRDCP